MSNKNKDKVREWELYTKAYEIASNKEQIKTGTYGDPEQSGILDNYYHLISTEGKLLARFSLDQMRASESSGNSCGSGCAWFMLGGGVTLATLVAAITLPVFLESPPAASRATNWLATIAKECAAKKADGDINPTFSIPEVKHYIFSPVNGDCNGDPNDLLSATSRKPSKYPSFFYNVVTQERSCLHKGPTGPLLGCSARKNGKW